MNVELVPLNSVFEIRHGSKLDLNKMNQCALNEASGSVHWEIRGKERVCRVC